MIANKEMLLYSAKRSIDAVGDLDVETATEEEVYYTIGTAIHWLVDCIERLHNEVLIDDKDDKKFSGLKFVNDCLKHKKAFQKAHVAIKGHIFPLKYKIQYDSVLFYRWSSLDDVKLNRRWEEDERQNYKEEFEGNEVYPSLFEIFKIILKYYQAL